MKANIFLWVKKTRKAISRFALWVLVDFLGVRLVWKRIRPPLELATGRRPPSSFLFWLIAVYVAFFGVASQRYENKIDLIENRANAVFAQLSSPKYKYALSRIAIVQKMQCPRKPEILDPISILSSLFGEPEYHDEMVDALKETIENWKDDLSSVDLSKADLQGCDLRGANFEGADLSKADLSKANLKDAKFSKAFLRQTNFLEANLEGADFRDAILSRANLQTSQIKGTVFEGAWLDGVQLVISEKDPNLDRNSIYTQLSKARTLWQAQLNPALEKALQKEFPKLFEAGALLPSAPSSIRVGVSPPPRW